VVQRGLTPRFSNLALNKFSNLKEFMEAARQAAAWHDRTAKRMENINMVAENQNVLKTRKPQVHQSPSRSNWKEKQQSRTFRRTPPGSPSRRQIASPGSPGKARSPQSQRSKCFNCNGPGHFARDCRAKRSVQNANSNAIERSIAELRNQLLELAERMHAMEARNLQTIEPKNE
ncbi:hypothetical protein B4U79_17100, partial [Dinothrombium tinctorium]